MGLTQSMTVLVTGGSGFVGSHVLNRLSCRGHRVVATTTGQHNSVERDDAVQWVSWDATREPLPEVEWHNLDAVLHLAKPDTPFDFPHHAGSIYEVSVSATFRLLEAARANQVRRFVLASTGDVSGPDDSTRWETGLAYTPNSFYGTCKACAELLTRSYQHVLSTAVLRFYYPYGPGGDRYIVSRLIQAVSRGKPVTIEGPQGIRLNPVWVEDLAEGVCLALQSNESGVFDLAGRDTFSLRELAEMVGRLLGREAIIHVGPVRDAECRVGNVETARRRLGYQPTVSMREGLTRLLHAAAEVAP